jgi:adenylate cyclase
MMDRAALIVSGSLLIAIGAAWAVGPVRLLAGAGRRPGLPTRAVHLPARLAEFARQFADRANCVAKKNEKHGGAVLLLDEAAQDAALAQMELTDLWGIAGRLAASLRAIGINTPLDLKRGDPRLIRERLGVVTMRLALELRGVACMDLEQEIPRPQKPSTASGSLWRRKVTVSRPKRRLRRSVAPGSSVALLHDRVGRAVAGLGGMTGSSVACPRLTTRSREGLIPAADCVKRSGLAQVDRKDRCHAVPPRPRPIVTGSAPVERRLSAILAADVVGYSRLMGADEIGTLRQLMAHRRELMDPTIAARRGRIVKTTGDGILAEFPIAVEAVACAITVQQGLASRNDAVPEESRLAFRIGINLGDIIIEANDIFGDGVNVAARLETLCQPGGLCVSRAVRDQVRDKLPIAFDDLGEQTVKNIARPVRAFGLSPGAIIATPNLPPSSGPTPTIHHRRWIGAAVAVAGIVAASAWWVMGGPATTPWQGVGTAPAAAHASIAVLPFASLGDSDRSDYFTDGLTEDIISALGRFREISVISRGGVFAYKGKSPTPAEIGRDLKVGYVVEGSVRRAAERLRVSVSLTDTSRSALLWSEKYDAEPKDIFAVQDQITRRISGALAVRVTSLELARSATKPPTNLEAYDLVLRGRDLLSRGTRSNNAEARGMFERAIELDPNYAPAYVGLGYVNYSAVNEGWTEDPNERAESLALKAVGLDDLSPAAHALRAIAESW